MRRGDLKQFIEIFQKVYDDYLTLGGALPEYEVCQLFFNALPNEPTLTLWKNRQRELACDASEGRCEWKKIKKSALLLAMDYEPNRERTKPDRQSN